MLEAAIVAALAAQYFHEAQAACALDNARLWGRPICGPMLFVEPKSREMAANQADREGWLKPGDGVFTGRLPARFNVSNTASEVGGVRWSMILWPLPEDRTARLGLMLHESFHRIQPDLGLPMNDPPNPQLDTPEGRVWLQLEWRALRAALTAEGEARKSAIADALAFRRRRRELFPGAGASENALEMNEGLAEYTGVKLSGQSAVKALEDGAKRPSFVRSFAYASGPAYGFLLDDTGVAWRKRLSAKSDLGQMLADALGIEPAVDAESRTARYDAASLRAAETRREQERQKRLAEYRAGLVDGPVLILPIGKVNVQFNPTELVPMEPYGTVYPTLRAVDAWGVLEVSRGALVDWKSAKIEVSWADRAAWKLDLAPDWEIVPGSRAGDYTVTRKSRSK